ncbi:MAG TPA: rhomboid family intramembrane serine protease [Vicinamibacterales bacterium]|nr:rhomboid family intramembrane serine protease [Vicinamibacterales bacterium]
MIPIRDVIPSRTTPWVTTALIGANGLVFLYELTLSDRGLMAFFYAYGLVPARFSWSAAFTSMFLHSGWVHIGGNMLSLWIFGDNVEDRLGHGRFLVFYLLVGLIANLAQTVAGPGSTLPLVGASGAIAGVMGAYFVMFPTSRVLVLLFLFVFVDVVEIPAVFFLGFWFLAQILGGVGRIADSSVSGGVAFWAHAGGFLSGILLVWVFRKRERQRVDWWSA